MQEVSSTTGPKAIVVLYFGADCPDEIIATMGHLLIDKNICVPELLEIKYKDSEGVANSLIHDSINSSKFAHNIASDTMDPVKAAITYIGTRYKKELSGANGLTFILKVGEDIRSSQWRKARGLPGDEELLNAIEILSEKTLFEEETNLAYSYKITPDILNSIYKIRDICVTVNRE